VLQHASFFHPTSSLPKISPYSPGSIAKSEDVGLIARAVSFQVFQPMWDCGHDPPTSRTDRRTDGQTTCDSKTALCTVVHRAVIKTMG